jgi:S1-C subfamily serine protease
LSDPEKFATFVRSLKVGDKVRLVIFREGKTKKIELVVTERPILPGDLPPDY